MSRFEVVRPPVGSDFSGAMNVDELVPDPDWLWAALQWHCEPECCGLDAYEFSEAAIRHALGENIRLPRRITPGRGKPDNVAELVESLAEAADRIRNVDAPWVATTRLSHYLTPASMADLLDYLASTLHLAWVEAQASDDRSSAETFR